MGKHSHTESERSRAKEKQLKALQLLMLLLPRENAVLLESLLDLLHKVASVPENKMSAASLGVVFSPSLLCPRKVKKCYKLCLWFSSFYTNSETQRLQYCFKDASVQSVF